MIKYFIVMYMKKFLLIIFILLLTFGCRKVDSILFKEDFEKENYNTKIKVNIPSDNPMTYITEEDLIKKIENKEDIIVLFGYSKSIETRSMIENLITIAKNSNIKTIYYLDILEIRDEKIYQDNEIKTTKNGTEDYNKLIDIIIKKFSYLKEDESLICIGHGSNNCVNSIYERLNYMFKEKGFKNIFVATIKGYSNLSNIILELKDFNPKKITLMPLMIVSGNHVLKDIIGDNKDSWKSILEDNDFKVEYSLKSLGEYKLWRVCGLDYS